MFGKSCTVVLKKVQTDSRKWQHFQWWESATLNQRKSSGNFWNRKKEEYKKLPAFVCPNYWQQGAKQWRRHQRPQKWRALLLVWILKREAKIVWSMKPQIFQFDYQPNLLLLSPLTSLLCPSQCTPIGRNIEYKTHLNSLRNENPIGSHLPKRSSVKTGQNLLISKNISRTSYQHENFALKLQVHCARFESNIEFPNWKSTYNPCLALVRRWKTSLILVINFAPH